MKEQEGDSLSASSHHLGQSPRNGGPAPELGVSSLNPNPRVRHVYLEEQNVYGRFVPYLLLKDRLDSQVDSSGTTALNHMCSHDSPYLPLYLSTLHQGDPILNRTTNLGHAPLDVAGMYCRKEYMELLRAKGAVDEGRVDTWAIQGANIANWSGNVDPSKKHLIHWAAFNDLPDVLVAFARAGANVNEKDGNGNTPIDLTVINKCYRSAKVLGEMGFRPQLQLLQKAESPSLTTLFRNLDRSRVTLFLYRVLKLSFVPLLIIFQLLVVTSSNAFLLTLGLLFWALLAAGKDPIQISERNTRFFSELVQRNISYGYNHAGYMGLLIFNLLGMVGTLIDLEIESFLHAIYFYIILVVAGVFLVTISIQFYAIFTNTTTPQLLYPYKYDHLWRKVDYLPARRILIRIYKNPNRKNYQENLKQYWKLS